MATTPALRCLLLGVAISAAIEIVWRALVPRASGLWEITAACQPGVTTLVVSIVLGHGRTLTRGAIAGLALLVMLARFVLLLVLPMNGWQALGEFVLAGAGFVGVPIALGAWLVVTHMQDRRSASPTST